MSRSYKKLSIVTCGYGGKWKKIAKRFANKQVRKTEIIDGCMYKKIYCSWNICDFKWFVSKDNEDYNKYKRK